MKVLNLITCENQNLWKMPVFLVWGKVQHIFFIRIRQFFRISMIYLQNYYMESLEQWDLGSTMRADNLEQNYVPIWRCIPVSGKASGKYIGTL